MTAGRFLTLAQASELISTPAETIRYWVHVGKIKAFRPGRQVLVRESDLAALIEASEVSTLRVAKAKRTAKVRAA